MSAEEEVGLFRGCFTGFMRLLCRVNKVRDVDQVISARYIFNVKRILDF